jgi:hypothetical protein
VDPKQSIENETGATAASGATARPAEGAAASSHAGVSVGDLDPTPESDLERRLRQLEDRVRRLEDLRVRPTTEDSSGGMEG